MNVDFVALGGTAWTVGGAMIVACTDFPFKIYTSAHEFLQMVLPELERLFFRKSETPYLRALLRKPFAELHAMSSSIY